MHPEIVKSIREILHTELLAIGTDFRKLIDKRSSSIKSREDKKTKLDF